MDTLGNYEKEKQIMMKELTGKLQLYAFFREVYGSIPNMWIHKYKSENVTYPNTIANFF